MKKVGLLTFHYSTNYGGVLQAYALYNTLKGLGFQVEVIDLVPKEYHQKSVSLTLLINTLIKRPAKLFELFKKIFIKNKNNESVFREFEIFREQFFERSKRFNRQEFEKINLNKYDYIVVGSDQVWNNHEAKYDQYFLNYNTTAKKISYAADSTDSSIPKDYICKLKACLEGFSFISVRNNHTYEYVNKISGIEPEVTADPTLLWDFEELQNTSVEGEYIFAYILGEEIDGGHDVVIDKIRKKYGNMPIYLAQISNMDFKLTYFSDKTYYNLSPVEWLDYLRGAKFVYTDSYHGVLFSVKFKKPFIAYYKDPKRAPRFIDLKSRYKLEKYIVSSATEVNLDEPIKYDFVDVLIQEHRVHSLNFLKSAMK